MILVKCGKVTNLVLFVYHKVSKLKSPEELYSRLLDSVSLLFQSETFNFSKKETVAQVFQVFSCEFCEIPKNIFFYRTPLGDCFCSCIYRAGMRMVRNSNKNYDHKYKEFEVQIFSILCNKNKQEPCLNADYKELQNFHFIQTD